LEADKALAHGDLERARSLMSQAAALDSTYAVRAELIGTADSRAIRVAATVRRILVPFLVSQGFSGESTSSFARERGDVKDLVLVGRDKFGGRLGLMGASTVGGGPAVYFDWRTVGNRTGSLAYSTQGEIEAVCRRWCELLQSHLLPWFEERR
jgi:hypothetical protein